MTDQNKKIDIVVKYFLPVMAGIEVNVLETYSKLVENGWQVTVHTSKDTYLEKNILPERSEIRGIKVKRYQFRWYGFFPVINYQETNLVALHNFDIFPHSHLLLLFAIKKLMGKKNFALVLTPHGGFNPEWSIFSLVQRLIKRTYHDTVGKWLVNFVVDGVRAVSQWEKREMVKSGIEEEKVQTITNGLENEAFLDIEKQGSKSVRAEVKSYGRYIFGNARIYEIKNQKTIIRALPLIPKDIKFVNVGTVGSTIGNQTSTDEYLQRLKKLAKELGVEDRVIFPGIVKGVDKYYLFKHAICFVHMAIWESFCNVVAEAISQGQICIVANNTALPFLVKDGINGFLVETHDYKKLAEKINFVLDPKNKVTVENIQKNNLDCGQKNTWTNVAEKMGKFYVQLVNKLDNTN